MNNQELERQIKDIIDNENMFDMIIAAKEFEPEYKKSDFYKATKMPLMEVIKNAKTFYSLSVENIKEQIQRIVNSLDFSNFADLLDQAGEVFAKENNDTMSMLSELKDFKDIIKDHN